MANSLATLARLGSADSAANGGLRQPLKVAAASIAGSDALGSFHTAQQQKAGVATVSQPLLDSGTGALSHVMALTGSPPGSRS